MDHQEYFKANQKLWDAKTPVHLGSGFYDLDAFKAGASSLKPEELQALGDVAGKRLLHLQCHFGQDTLSWARCGAEVTGIDLSPAAIQAAKDLSRELEIPATFVEGNVYDTPDLITPGFDIVFTSYGVIGWLPDMDRWAKVISDMLNPGGIFYMIEFHPVIWMFDEDVKEIGYPYFNKEVIHDQEEATYADKESYIGLDGYSWNHSIGEVVSALLDHGLEIDLLEEYDYSNYNVFPNMVQDEKGRFRSKEKTGYLPWMYAIKAVKR
jgi:SAM-dependent methyltransferase